MASLGYERAWGDGQIISPVESMTDQAKYQVKCKRKRLRSNTSDWNIGMG
jgi:hypothetical protein